MLFSEKRGSQRQSFHNGFVESRLGRIFTGRTKTEPRPAHTESDVLKLPTALLFEDTVGQLSLEPLQEWEGYVTEIGESTFVARLVDLTANEQTEDEVADFLISDLSDDDLSLLKEGAGFRWVIGYQRRRSGQKIRASQIVFRRLPAWTNRDIKAAQARAEQLLTELHWD
ncbi:MAG: hypothetical protein ABR929_05595 [Roseiarcus sp.]